jgi:hypothetical protein
MIQTAETQLMESVNSAQLDTSSIKMVFVLNLIPSAEHQVTKEIV